MKILQLAVRLVRYVQTECFYDRLSVVCMKEQHELACVIIVVGRKGEKKEGMTLESEDIHKAVSRSTLATLTIGHQGYRSDPISGKGK